MRTKIVSVLLKLTLYLLFMLSSASGLYAQTDFPIGATGMGSNGTTSYPAALQDWYEGSRAQYLYKASELTAKGMGPGFINAVKFNVTDVNNCDIIEQYAIKIGTTTIATLDAVNWENVGTIIRAGQDYQPVAGINSFPMSTSFFWNGTDNILIEVCSGDPSNTTGGSQYTQNASTEWTTGLTFNGSHSLAQDNEGNLCGTAGTFFTGDETSRPNIIFNWTPAVACTGVPNAGTTVTSVSAVCLNESFNLILTGATVASGLTYQWQSSTNNTTWTNIPGATFAALTTSQAASTYYRCVVTCTTGGTASSASVQVTSPTLVSGTFTINKTLPTAGTNFASFNDAYNYIKCGINGPVIFNVVTGTGPYNEQLNMIPVPGASATNTVTFNGNANTLAYLSTNGNEREVIKLNGADHIIFNDLVINALGSSASEYGFGVQLLNDANYNTINNCTIIVNTTSTSTNFAGIVISPSANSATNSGVARCDTNTISNNTIIGGYYGITMVGNSTDASNAGNKIINNKISDFYYYGIYVLGAFNTVIEKNTFSRPTRTDVSEFYGIYLTGLSTKININANSFSDPFGGAPTSTNTFYGIYLGSVDAIPSLENIVSNNLVYNLSGSGSVYGIYNSSSDNVWYYHNTISLDGAATPSATYTTRGFYQTSDAGGINFINNIITITRGGLNSKYGMYFNSTSSQIISNYNDIFITPALTNAFTGYSVANRATMADWRTATTQDANSIIANPVYKDITTGNYAPTSAAVNDRGTAAGIPADIISAVRSATTPDMGAYEFTPEICTTPPVAGTASVNISPVCTDVAVSLNLAGNSMGLTQTYQWQYSTAATGTYANLGVPINYPDTTIRSTSTLYYRAAVTCGANTTYSTPVLLTVDPALPGGTYTIDKTAPASAVNFVSFNDAKAAMHCGISGPVVFNVIAGRTTYEEQLVLDSIRGVSVINTITFLGNGNTIHFSSSNTDERAVIKLRHADYITFDSLTIDATGTGNYGYGVQLVNYADSNTIRRCNIITNVTSTSANYVGIVINAEEDNATSTGSTRCTGNTFSNNKVTGGYYGVTLVGDNSDPVIGNRFTGNTIQEFYEYGFYLNCAYNTQIRGNLITRPTRTNSSTFYAIYVLNQSGLLNVSENKITNPFGGQPGTTNQFYGIYFSGADAPTGATNVVSNNIIYNINGLGSSMAIYNSASANVVYYHNSILLDNTGGVSGTTIRGFYQTDATSELKFINNIIAITGTGNSTKHAIYLNDQTTDIITDNNDYYVRGGGNSNYIGFYATNFITLQDWQTTTSRDAASVSLDPVFADVPNGNLTPVRFDIDNLGQPVGITTDILNKTRSAVKPDIGAYEIDITLCTTPLNAGAAVVTPNTGICLGTPITLDLTGNTPGGRLTYQWQAAISANGPWINISDTMYVSMFRTELGMTNFYRCRIVCSGTDTAYSTVTSVNMNQPLIKGLYTINPAGSGSRNYPSFVAAVAAMECGIAGEVIFDVVPGTYTEQVRMHKIGGASDTSRVTFRSQNGDPASAILTFATTAANNYVLKLDSASFVTYKNLTITATGTTNARVVEVAGVTAFDSLLNNNINMPATTTNNTNIVGVYANAFNGKKIAIIGNTITNGASGIYFTGPSTNIQTPGLAIDSNTVNGAYVNGIYAGNAANVLISRNTINRTAPLSSSSYGIYATYVDTTFRIIQNKVNISNATTTVYGIYVNNSRGALGLQGLIAANKILAFSGNTGSVYGLYVSNSGSDTIVNNVVSVATTGTTSYGIYSTTSNNLSYYNNSILNASASTGNTNAAAYFNATTAANGNIILRNNIFSQTGGGFALLVGDPLYVNSDYNTLYSSGTNLIRATSSATNYTTLDAWRTAVDLDISSIVYKPAFVSSGNLEPDVNNAEVWAIHGRGVQVKGNNYDFNNQYRPVTLAEGVPDMGAYEFLPAVEPPLLQPEPLAPAAGITQRFMFGTDTVAKITWSPAAAVPTDITLKRYSGIKPPKLATGRQFMYYYTDIDATGSGAYNFDMQQFYVDSWQGTMDKEESIRFGRTNSDSAWVVNDSSTVDVTSNVISDTALSYLDRFTGLKGNLPDVPELPTMADSSNSGTRFWVGYGHHQFFGTDNSQSMVLYLSATQLSHVTVKINGTSWKKEYVVPARSVLVSDLIPKAGLSDARLFAEGFSTKGISIESDAPIVAYAHIYGNTSSGATMLLPVGTYGYEYYALMSRQYYSTNTYAWFYVVADNDNTVVEIIPSRPTLGGHAAGVPFTVTLNKGEIYQVLGALLSGSEGYDLSGSKIRSVSNADGKCYPVGVFSGNSRTGIGCDGTVGSSSGDNNIQQNFPSQAWGQHYLTAPTSTAEDATLLMTNIYRVMVKDTSTAVLLNGVRMRGLINNRYYQYQSDVADYIEADKPIMVAQFMATAGACPNTGGDGDPEMFYISPVEQGVKTVGLYRNTVESINVNYLTLILPTPGLPSLLIDGTNTFDYTYDHPNRAGYSVVVKRWLAAKAQSIVTSDSAFTAVTYGLGVYESYGYNAGTLVRNLNMTTSFSNTFDSTGTSSKYTCAKTPFKITAILPIKPVTLTWQLSKVNNLVPATDVTQTNPVPVDSIIANGKKYYRFNLTGDYMFTTPGMYYIPVQMTHPDIESCNNTSEVMLQIKVITAPLVDFSIDYSGCVSDIAVLDGVVVTENNAGVNNWKWNFADGTTAVTKSVTKKYPAAGTYIEELHIITTEGCIGDTAKEVLVNDPGNAVLVEDTITVCYGTSVTFTVKDPEAGVIYNWYNAATNGTLLGSGISYTIPSAISKGIYYVETIKSGCPGSSRTPATLLVLPLLTTPVVTVDSVGVNAIKFTWNAIPAATGYEVSIDNGVTWTDPSSGPLGLEHIVTGLRPVQSVTLIVKAKGCEDKISDPASGITLTDGIYIPNTFSPNGDGLNDALLVYGAIIKEVHFMVFNQWGEKVFESNTQSLGWNGTYKGKAQPSGVYIYVCKLKLLDGTEIDRKGSVNLIR